MKRLTVRLSCAERISRNLLDVLCVGHVSIDTVKTRHFSGLQLGGAALYSAIASKRMGLDAGLISKVGEDFPDEYALKILSYLPKAIILRSKDPTTRFLLVYSNGKRSLQVLSICSPILKEDLREKAKLAILAPIVGELDGSWIDVEAEIRIAMIQGFVRPPRRGPVRPARRLDPSLVSSSSYLIGDEEEFLVGMGASTVADAASKALELGCAGVIVTLGSRGSLLFLKDAVWKIPAKKVRTFDPTGAGDVLVGVFASYLLETSDPLLSACAGSIAASLSVERRGISSPPTRELVEEELPKILKRASQIR